MLTSDFDYSLPPELIAQQPIEPRDHSRLMVVHRTTYATEERHFFDLPAYLVAGDVVVWNNSKVFKARLTGTIILNEEISTPPIISSGVIGRNERPVEIFLVRPMENKGVWKVLAKPARKLRLGMTVKFAEDFWCEVLLKDPDGTLLVQFSDDANIVREKANRYGSVPLPPYVDAACVKQTDSVADERYQTVYAKNEGSVAAPTAGFHFTPELIARLKNQNVLFAEITLHVGLGTFLPVKTEQIADHQMHSEWVELTPENARIINDAKKNGRRIIAVGTTTVRVLEGLGELQSKTVHDSLGQTNELQPFTGDLNVFIVPGFRFKIIDALITNFHLPKSTLLMLVSAFMGSREFALTCYQQAVARHYRFYSFGDAMLII